MNRSSSWYKIFTACLLLPVAFQASAKKTNAVVIGRLLINDGSGKHYYKGAIRIGFNGHCAGSLSTVIPPEDSGYFRMELPPGNNYLSCIRYYGSRVYLKSIQMNYAVARIDAVENTYYIGDLDVLWHLDQVSIRKGNAGAIIGGISGGLIGAAIGGMIDGSRNRAVNEKDVVPITVSNNPGTVAYFSQNKDMDSTGNIIYRPLDVNKAR